MLKENKDKIDGVLLRYSIQEVIYIFLAKDPNGIFIM